MSKVLRTMAASFAIAGKSLLDNIDLRIDAGELIAIVGPNGAGKSTLLRLLSGDLRPTGGSVLLRGQALSSYGARELARRRAMLAQHVNVSFPFTVEEIVWMGASDLERAIAAPFVEAALREVGLEAFRGRTITTLSGGEQQRAHFARVLVQLWGSEAIHGPGILLLDEPTSSLDIRHQLDLANTARRCARHGTTVIAILHDLNLAARFADRIIVLHDGAIAADGTPTQVMQNAVIDRVFDVELAIQLDGTGRPFVLPELAGVA
jgi:iron complex transport system ATP-binding protein